MRAAARLKPDKAGRMIGEKGQNILSGKLLVEQFFSLLILTVNLKFVLGDVQTDGIYFAHVPLLLCFWVIYDTPFGTEMPFVQLALWRGAGHPIKKAAFWAGSSFLPDPMLRMPRK